MLQYVFIASYFGIGIIFLSICELTIWRSSWELSSWNIHLINIILVILLWPLGLGLLIQDWLLSQSDRHKVGKEH